MGSRRLSRQPNGRFRRATLENTFGLSAPTCPSCRRLNPHGVGEPPPETCHACGKPMQPEPALPPVEFMSVDEFYDARPARRTSGESDYGVQWQANGRDWPTWKVSYIRATGEVYAACQGGRNGQVRVLGVVPPDPGGCYYATLNRILDGWADPDVTRHDLAWVARKLANVAEARHG